jgi:hypothetical protein
VNLLDPQRADAAEFTQSRKGRKGREESEVRVPVWVRRHDFIGGEAAKIPASASRFPG